MTMSLKIMRYGLLIFFLTNLVHAQANLTMTAANETLSSQLSSSTLLTTSTSETPNETFKSDTATSTSILLPVVTPTTPVSDRTAPTNVSNATIVKNPSKEDTLVEQQTNLVKIPTLTSLDSSDSNNSTANALNSTSTNAGDLKAMPIVDVKLVNFTRPYVGVLNSTLTNLQLHETKSDSPVTNVTDTSSQNSNITSDPKPPSFIVDPPKIDSSIEGILSKIPIVQIPTTTSSFAPTPTIVTSVDPIITPIVTAPPVVDPVFTPIAIAPPVVDPVFTPIATAPPVVDPVFTPVVTASPVVEPISQPQFETPVAASIAAPITTPIASQKEPLKNLLAVVVPPSTVSDSSGFTPVPSRKDDAVVFSAASVPSTGDTPAAASKDSPVDSNSKPKVDSLTTQSTSAPPQTVQSVRLPTGEFKDVNISNGNDPIAELPVGTVLIGTPRVQSDNPGSKGDSSSSSVPTMTIVGSVLGMAFAVALVGMFVYKRSKIVEGDDLEKSTQLPIDSTESWRKSNNYSQLPPIPRLSVIESDQLSDWTESEEDQESDICYANEVDSITGELKDYSRPTSVATEPIIPSSPHSMASSSDIWTASASSDSMTSSIMESSPFSSISPSDATLDLPTSLPLNCNIVDNEETKTFVENRKSTATVETIYPDDSVSMIGSKRKRLSASPKLPRQSVFRPSTLRNSILPDI